MVAKLEIPEWTGSTLTIGAFSEYAGRVVEVFRTWGYENLALGEIEQELEGANTRLADFINRERAYDETAAVAKADSNRDALWKAFYHAWSYLMELDQAHPLYAAAMTLRSEMTPYKEVDRHELAKETSELKGLQRDLDKPQNVSALQTLGLTAIVQALFTANAAVERAMTDRDTERGSRIAGKGADTTQSLRKALSTLLAEAYRQVNAADRISQSEATETTIRDVNGIIAHYKDIAAQPAKRKGGDEPEPEPEPEASAS